MTATLIETFTLTNNCTCEQYDEDTDTSRPADYCYGDCYTEQCDFVLEMLGEWARAIDYTEHGDDLLRIEGRAMGWTRASGEAFTNSLAGIVGLLRIDRAEWHLVFKRDGNLLTVVRYSHDEPTGASFTIEPVKEA